MTGFPAIHPALTPANHGMRAGLEIQIRLPTHWFDEVDNRWEAAGIVSRLFSNIYDFNILRANSEHYQPPGKISRGRKLRDR